MFLEDRLEKLAAGLKAQHNIPLALQLGTGTNTSSAIHRG